MTVLKCVGRRRIVVQPEGDKLTLHLWFRDPPNGRRIASLELSKEERDKLLFTLTDAKATDATT